MQAMLIENNGNARMAYDSLILDNPKAFSALNSKVAFKIVKSLASSPASAIDVSRKLKIHEQKVYYHIRRLERAGIIYTISNEKRHGMIAKIFSVVSPVIAAKLYEKGIEVKESNLVNIDSSLNEFFYPIIENGKLNAKVIVGNPYPHGKYEEAGTEGSYIFDIALFLGRYLTEVEFPYCFLDTDVRETDLKGNLILVGNSWSNVILDKVNEYLPVQFDNMKRAIFSKTTNRSYKEPSIGIIVTLTNPFNTDKKILVLGGTRTRGIRSCAIALTKHLNLLLDNNKQNGFISRVILGLDKDGDNSIDSIRILE